LQRAKDEDEVRNWIVEQMNFRSRRRFHAYREARSPTRTGPISSSPHCRALRGRHGGQARRQEMDAGPARTCAPRATRQMIISNPRAGGMARLSPPITGCDAGVMSEPNSRWISINS
jgi:hypothetical protein